ncbi:MAG: nitroreductase family protein [Muribaculum sp.]|nr:nitroreductase family protein [Muribaculum sp.]
MYRYIREILRTIKTDISLLKEMYRYFRLIQRHNGSVKTLSCQNKTRALIMRESHVLEKGMSLPSPHFPFGANRANALIDYLTVYAKSDNYDKYTIDTAISSLKSYLEYNRSNGADLQDVEQKLTAFTNSLKGNIDNNQNGGIATIDKSDILSDSKKDFEHLLNSRHSFRNFSDIPVSRQQIEQALQLARSTPSACNRQAWRTHVFTADNATKILNWQGGCRGFADKIKTIILITSDLNAFFAHETMQAYIDGGLYAMNLINSLHFTGLATIPLSCGIPVKKLQYLHQFGIPENEIPILIVGVGNIPEKTNVAVSHKVPYAKTNTFHD